MVDTVDGRRRPDGPIIRIDHVWKSFGSLAVLTDVSLPVKKGGVVRIVGP